MYTYGNAIVTVNNKIEVVQLPMVSYTSESELKAKIYEQVQFYVVAWANRKKEIIPSEADIMDGMSFGVCTSCGRCICDYENSFESRIMDVMSHMMKKDYFDITFPRKWIDELKGKVLEFEYRIIIGAPYPKLVAEVIVKMPIRV